MADTSETEKIGLELEKREAERKDNAADTEELRPSEVEVIADDVIEEIDDGMRDRINKLVANGEFIQFTVKDLDLIILPTPDEDGTVPLAKFQFRRVRDNYDELKEDIEVKGITKYIILKREVDEFGFASYHVLDGNTRIQILRELLAEDPDFPIPTFIVLDCSDADATLIAKNYNNFSENLDSEDDQFAVIRSIEVGGISQAEAARRYDYSESYVSDIVSAFQKVPVEVREMIESRKLSVKHGTQLARLRDYPRKQKSLATKSVKKCYSSKDLKNEVTKEILRIGFLDDGAKAIDDIAGKYSTEGNEGRQKTESEVDNIHRDLQKTFGVKQTYGSDYKLMDDARTVEAGATKAAAKSILKKAGYTIVADPEPSESKKGEEQKGESPQIALMPSDDELMEDVSGNYICTYCGGSTHPAVVDKLGFNAEYHYNSEKYLRGESHHHCIFQAHILKTQAKIVKLNNDIVDFEKKLKKEKLSVRMEKKGLTLEQINEEATGIYAKAVVAKKKEWFLENIPLDKLRKSNPDLVPEHYWESIEMYLLREEGFESLKTAASNVGDKGVSHQSFSNQLKKVRQALASIE